MYPLVESVEIHNSFQLVEGPHPLWDVEATLKFEDGTQQSYYFEWAKESHTNALKHPQTDSAASELADLLESETTYTLTPNITE